MGRMGAWLGKLQCRVTTSEASQETEKRHIFSEENSPHFGARRSSSLWDMSCLSHTRHLKTGLQMIHRQQLKAPLSLCSKVLMLKVKPCTSVLGLQAFSMRKLCLMGHLLLLALHVSFGLLYLPRQRWQFQGGLFYSSAIASGENPN